MVASEFYSRDPIEGYQLIGTLPEKRKNLLRITQESVMNLGKKILVSNIEMNDIFFIQVTIDKNTGNAFQAHPFYRPFKRVLRDNLHSIIKRGGKAV